MFGQPIIQMRGSVAAVVTLASWREILNKIWGYLTETHYGFNNNIHFSVTTIAQAIVIFTVAVLLSPLFDLLARRTTAPSAR